MKLITRLVQRENFIDSQNDLFTSGCLKANHGKIVPITLEFNNLNPPIGQAKLIYKKGKGLYAKMNFIELEKAKGLKPAISGRVEKQIKNQNINKIIESEVFEIGCCKQSIDSSLRKI